MTTPSTITNETPQDAKALLRSFQSAVRSFETGSVKSHQALVGMLVHAAHNSWDSAGLTAAMQYTMERPAARLATAGVRKWLADIVGCTVADDGTVRFPRNKAGLDAAWLAKAKATPWYDVAADAVELKMPEVSFSALTSVVAKRLAAGAAVDFGAIREDFERALRASEEKATAPKVLDWAAAYRKQQAEKVAA